MGCTVSAYLLRVPHPEQIRSGSILPGATIETKLTCSKKANHKGSTHQAYHGDRLFTWLYPDPNDQPTRVLPTEAEVADAIEDAYSGWVASIEAGEDVTDTEYEAMARAALALFAGHPTVAQVKAEALREG